MVVGLDDVALDADVLDRVGGRRAADRDGRDAARGRRHAGQVAVADLEADQSQEEQERDARQRPGRRVLRGHRARGDEIDILDFEVLDSAEARGACRGLIGDQVAAARPRVAHLHVVEVAAVGRGAALQLEQGGAADDVASVDVDIAVRAVDEAQMHRDALIGGRRAVQDDLGPVHAEARHRRLVPAGDRPPVERVVAGRGELLQRAAPQGDIAVAEGDALTRSGGVRLLDDQVEQPGMGAQHVLVDRLDIAGDVEGGRGRIRPVARERTDQGVVAADDQAIGARIEAVLAVDGGAVDGLEVVAVELDPVTDAAAAGDALLVAIVVGAAAVDHDADPGGRDALAAVTVAGPEAGDILDHRADRLDDEALRDAGGRGGVGTMIEDQVAHHGAAQGRAVVDLVDLVGGVERGVEIGRGSIAADRGDHAVHAPLVAARADAGGVALEAEHIALGHDDAGRDGERESPGDGREVGAGGVGDRAAAGGGAKKLMAPTSV